MLREDEISFVSSDGPVAKASSFLSSKFRFDFKSDQTNDFKIAIHSFPV